VLSSHPEYLSSVDDFYYTNSNLNDTLYDLLNPNILLTWDRIIYGIDYLYQGKIGSIYSKKNSWIYNN